MLHRTNGNTKMKIKIKIPKKVSVKPSVRIILFNLALLISQIAQKGWRT